MPMKIKPKEITEQQIKQAELASNPQNLQLKTASEEQAHEWLLTLANEIDDIESFYKSKLEELIQKFILMQAKYLIKLENDENYKLTPDTTMDENKKISIQTSDSAQVQRLYVSPLDGKILKLDKRDAKSGNMDENQESSPQMKFDTKNFKIKGRQTYLVQIYENVVQEYAFLTKQENKWSISATGNQIPKMGDDTQSKPKIDVFYDKHN